MSEAVDFPKLSEHILEIRIKPNPSFLDYRGEYAQTIKKLMGLQNWQINSNRIDIFDEENTIRAFLSFKNLGFVMKNSVNKNYFADQSIKFVKYVLSNKPFETPIHVMRLGVRSRFVHGVDINFSDLLSMYMKTYVNLSDKAKEIINAKIIDFGSPINFETPYGKINSLVGPMEKTQLQEFFPSVKDVPNVALYVDLDYWKVYDRQLKTEEITSAIKQYSGESWDIDNQLFKLITG